MESNIVQPYQRLIDKNLKQPQDPTSRPYGILSPSKANKLRGTVVNKARRSSRENYLLAKSTIEIIADLGPMRSRVNDDLIFRGCNAILPDEIRPRPHWQSLDPKFPKPNQRRGSKNKVTRTSRDVVRQGDAKSRGQSRQDLCAFGQGSSSKEVNGRSVPAPRKRTAREEKAGRETSQELCFNAPSLVSSRLVRQEISEQDIAFPINMGWWLRGLEGVGCRCWKLRLLSAIKEGTS
ncbi:hypothetical protein V8F20_002620 [Naviculisporaceae sp. PSN 640]